jgi:hypothetical protein
MSTRGAILPDWLKPELFMNSEGGYFGMEVLHTFSVGVKCVVL